MAAVFVSVGSNIEPADNIRAAVRALRARYAPLSLSSVYESAAVGFAGDNFYNLVLAFETTDEVQQVAAALRAIEDRQARDRRAPRFSARTIDLDLLLYDDLVIERDGIHIPRDEITRNAFVLWPLAELAPERRHPLIGQSYAELWRDYDKTRQSLWPIPFAWD